MPSPGFTPESERYMMDHMNADHADSNLMYVKVYGNLWRATAARMVTLDKEGMDLEVTVPDGSQRLRIPFDHGSKTKPMRSAPWWPCRGTPRQSSPRQASRTRRYPEMALITARGQAHVIHQVASVSRL